MGEMIDSFDVNFNKIGKRTIKKYTIKNIGTKLFTFG